MLYRYTNWVIHRHKWIVLTILISIAILSLGLPRLDFTNDFRVYFSEDNPQLAALERLERTYSKQDNVYFFIVPRKTDIFSKDVMTLIWELTEQGWQIPYSQRVSSLSNYQHSYGMGDDLVIEPLIENPAILDTLAISHIKKIVLNEPTLLNNLLPRDGSATSINVTLSLPDDDLQANHKAIEFAKKMIHNVRLHYPDIDIYLSGSSMFDVTLGEAVKQDLQILVVLSYTIIITGLLVLLKSFTGTFVTFLVLTLSIIGTMGFFGWLRFVLTPVAGFAPSVILTIAVADCVHILVSFFHELHRGKPKEEAIRESLRINHSPIFITSITTIIGVLCLNFTDSPPYRDLGNMVALGVLIAYGLSISLLPALLAWFPMGKSPFRPGLGFPMDRFAEWVLRTRKILFPVFSILVLILTIFISRNQLTERWHEYFDETFDLRQALDARTDHIGGIHLLYYNLDSGKTDGINEPAYLKDQDNFADWYRRQPGIVFVGGLADILKRLNKNMHGDDPQLYQLPDRRELAAQYLLLYELSVPTGMGLDDIINIDRSATRLAVVVEKTDSESLLKLDRMAQNWLHEHAQHILPTEGSGLDMIFAHINHRNIRSMLKGTALALVLISLVLIFALRSIRLGLISLIPNLAPAAMSYGLWGFFIGRIDLALSVVICLSMGIVVDDTVHFLSKYLRARREQQLNTEEGIRYAFNTVGMAMGITSAVLVSGFSILAISHLAPTRETGILLAITLSFALIADFLFLPPLLMILDKRSYKR